MKALGFAAIAATAVSFLLWMITWAYWRYTEFVPYNSTDYDTQKTMRYIMTGIGTVSTLTEYLAILLVAIGLIIAANRLPKN